MKKKITVFISLGVMLPVFFTGCTKGVDQSPEEELKPGTYTGQSSNSPEDDGGGYAIVRLTVNDDREIEDIEFDSFDKNGNKKFSDTAVISGYDMSEDEYIEMGETIKDACDHYAQEYMKSKDLDKVDAVSGATVSCNQFKEAVSIALQKASE